MKWNGNEAKGKKKKNNNQTASEKQKLHTKRYICGNIKTTAKKRE